MAFRPGPHRDQEQTRLFGDGLGDGMGDHLDLHREGARFLQRLALVPDQFGGLQRLAHRLEPAGPCGLGGDQPDMAADRQAVIRQRLDGLQRARAVEGIRPVLIEREGPFQEIGCVPDLIEIVARKGKGGGRGLAEAAVHDHGGRDAQQFHPSTLCRFGLF